VKITTALDSTSLTKRYPRTILAITLFFMLGLPFLLYLVLLLMLPFNRPEALDAVAQRLGWDLGHSLYRDSWYGVILLVEGTFVSLYTAVFAGVTTWVERRIAGRMQSRIGPNRPGTFGFISWVGDAVKMLFKEDLIPAEADHLLFRAAPYFSMVGLTLPFVVLPFGESLIVADLNVGVFYLSATSAFIVVGILVSGWASNSKWSLFGAVRGAAQVVSYEIPAGIAIMVPVMMAGTLSMQGIIRAQGGWPWQWFACQNPAAFVAFFIAMTASLAEGNRTPFDLPEAESELVAGYHAEYSGFRIALFLMVEWANMWIMGALAVTLFLGGWQIPGVSVEMINQTRGTDVFPTLLWFGWQFASLMVFAIKTWALVILFIWLRWTLPRVRVDQMMSLCWKYLVPGAFACFIFTLFWVMVPAPVHLASGLVISLGVALLLVKFAVRTRKNIAQVKGARVDLSNW
jgi:NADH:ubiquinone oxidoreductase subunit 1 (chain H)